MCGGDARGVLRGVMWNGRVCDGAGNGARSVGEASNGIAVGGACNP